MMNMSLTKQLWLSIAVLISLAFVSGFLISTVNARSYYVEQLQVKNIDNANAMALTLATMDKDPVAIELLLAAQFDTGHYRRLELVSASGDTMVLKEALEGSVSVPAWFAALMKFEIAPGIAQIQDGWNLYGTLRVESQSDYALLALWQVSVRLLLWFSLIAVGCGLAGSLLLRMISRPLAQVVEQAEAMGERRFLTSAEPATLEFRRLVRAMNRLAGRVRSMLEAEARRLDDLRRKTQLDEVTGIANRAYFFSFLDSRLNQTEQTVQDALLVIRIQDLQGLNQRLGRVAMDRWLQAMVVSCQQVLEQCPQDLSGFQLGRLNGSDLALLLLDTTMLDEISQALLARLQQDCSLSDDDLPLVMAGCYSHSGDERSRLLAGLDQMLADLEQFPGHRLSLRDQPSALLFNSATEWQAAIRQALENQQVSISCYPVLSLQGKLLQQEAMLRLQLNGTAYPAGAVIGWARRVGLLPALDIQVARLALQAVQQGTQPVAVNLSAAALLTASSYLQLVNLLQEAGPELCAGLAFELDETVAIREPMAVANFVAVVKRCGAAVGLQAAGSQLGSIHELERLGLDYLKIEAALVQSSAQPEVQALLRGLCKLGHSLGCQMIAEGIQADADLNLLQDMGFDAITGPGAGPVLAARDSGQN